MRVNWHVICTTQSPSEQACGYRQHVAPVSESSTGTHPKVGIANRGSLHVGCGSRPNNACERWPRERRATVHRAHCAKSGHTLFGDLNGVEREQKDRRYEIYLAINRLYPVGSYMADGFIGSRANIEMATPRSQSSRWMERLLWHSKTTGL